MNEPDDLEDLLRPPGNQASPTLRVRLREQTSRHVRRTVIYRRFGWIAALAAAFAAGGATVWLARPTPEPELVFIDSSSIKPKPPEVTPPQLQSPHDLELAAEQADGAESAKLFLEAGQLYGGRFNDWDSALRCYRNALDLNPSLAQNPDPNSDDWLLVKLKNDWRDRDANP